MKMASKIVFIGLFAFVHSVIGEFNLTVVHISDFHSKWFELDENKHDCSTEESRAGKCYGGFSRLVTFVRDIRQREKNVLVLSSGEFFLGPSLHGMDGWRPAHHMLPNLELDAMSLSNHDFDVGPLELSAFLYSMKFPVVCANMRAKNTSFLHSRVNRSVVLEVNGTKIGVVGYLHRHALKKSKNAPWIKIVPEIPALQDEVTRLENDGINKIIALGHAGYFTDLDIAKNLKGVDIVMGGDSDIMLFDPGHDEFLKVGNYPRVHHQEPEVENEPSLVNRTLVLHIPQHGIYVGVLRATFDDNGKIIHESGAPVLLDNNTREDEDTLELLKFARGALYVHSEHSKVPDDSEILGNVLSTLEGNPRKCRMFECSLGNFIVDAMFQEYLLHYKEKSEHRNSYELWGPIDALVHNAGPIVRSIKPGYITIQHILKAFQLGSFMQRVYMYGQQVLNMMEHSVKYYDPTGVTAPGSFLLIAGLKVEYDLSKPPGRRVRSLTIKCRDCEDDNVYLPVTQHKMYIIAMPRFMQEGSDGFHDFEVPEDGDQGQFDAQLITEYLRRMFHVTPKIDGRIKFYQPKGQKMAALDIPPLRFGEPASEFNEKFFENEPAEEKPSDMITDSLDIKNERVNKEVVADHENGQKSELGNISEEAGSDNHINIPDTIIKPLHPSADGTINDIKNVIGSEKIPGEHVNIPESEIEDIVFKETGSFHQDHAPDTLLKPLHPSEETEVNGNNLTSKETTVLKTSDKSNKVFGDKVTSDEENDSPHFTKKVNVPIQYLKDEVTSTCKPHESKLTNTSEIQEFLKVLLDASPENFTMTLRKLRKDFPDFTRKSDLLEKISKFNSSTIIPALKDFVKGSGSKTTHSEFESYINFVKNNLFSIPENNFAPAATMVRNIFETNSDILEKNTKELKTDEEVKDKHAEDINEHRDIKSADGENIKNIFDEEYVKDLLKDPSDNPDETNAASSKTVVP